MRLNQIMKTPVQTIAPETPASVALARMRGAHIHHLVVLEKKEVIGILSARDLARAPGEASVAGLMSRAVALANPRTTVREAANLLRGLGIGCLPVLEGSRLVGMITISDLLELIGRGAERPTPHPTRRTLRSRGPRKPRPSEDRRGLVYGR
jgi:CBS domain-containing protein